MAQYRETTVQKRWTARHVVAMVFARNARAKSMSSVLFAMVTKNALPATAQVPILVRIAKVAESVLSVTTVGLNAMTAMVAAK